MDARPRGETSDTDDESISCSSNGRGAKKINAQSIEEQFHNLIFYINLTIRYHAKRKSFFSSWHYFIMAITSIFGSASFAFLYAGDDDVSKNIALWTTGFVGFLTGLDAAIGFIRKYSIHSDLQERFSDLLNEIEFSQKTEENLISLLSKRRIIEKDEPDDFQALHVLCYNQECLARGHNEMIFEISFLKKMFRHYIKFDAWIPKRMHAD